MTTRNLPVSKNIIAILNKKIFDKYTILKKIFKNNKIKSLQLNNDTLGQSDTCYKAKKIINQNEDLFIHSCDYVMKYSYKKFKKISSSCDVIIFTFKLKSSIIKNYNDFAYCKEKKGKVISISEKKIISSNPQHDHMAIGTFWFKKASDFFEMHEQSLKKKNYVKKELYVANNINLLIKKRKKVKIFEVNHWKNLGDYFSYNQYIYWKNFFLKN